MRILPQLPVLNMNIVRLGVTNYFSTQKSNGYFPRGQAIYKTIRGSRDIHNSYVRAQLSQPDRAHVRHR
jgi:hypothetical protein